MCMGEHREAHTEIKREGTPLFVGPWTESGGGRRQASPLVTLMQELFQIPEDLNGGLTTDKWLSPEGGTGLWTLGFAGG